MAPTEQPAKLAKPRDTWTRILHDIKNPAGVMVGYTDLLQKPHIANDPDKVRHYAHKLHYSSRLLLRLIQDLYDIGSQYPSAPTRQESYDPEDLISSICAPYALRAKNKGLFCKLSFGENLPNPIIIDGLRLGQIIGNLLDNSIKYTDKGGLYVTLTAHPPNQNQCMMTVSISDTGRGINEGLKDQVFEPYFRVSSHICEGQGIGLASARITASQIGGTLSLVESELGHGTTFQVEVPATIPTHKNNQ